MNKRNTYHPLAKFLHWSVFVIVAVQFISALFMPEFVEGTPVNFFVDMHMSFGFLIIPFAISLLLLRFYSPVEKLDASSSVLQSRATLVGHYLLYALLIILPFSGWASAFSDSVSVNIFHLFSLPQIFTNESFLRHLFGETHALFAVVAGLLVFIHIAMALYHHFVLKDSVLDRMRPTRKDC